MRGLREARMRAGLSQKELGDRVGLTRVAITQLELEPDRFPRKVQRVKDFAKVLGVPEDYFFYQIR